MDGKKISLLTGALLLAGVSAFAARSLFLGAASPQANAAGVPQAVAVGPEVLVATRALPVGTIIEPTAFRYQPWPKDLIEKAYYLKGAADAQNLIGTVVRNPVTAGQPITQGALVRPGDRGFLAAALGPGMRAVTVSVSQQSGVAGFVFPGDRVDLLLAEEVPGGGDGPALKASETIVRNLRVLATDQRTDNKVGEDGKTVVLTFSTVTLEATPKIAEKIAVAQSLGQLSLALRSIADNTSELESAIASGDVKVPDSTDPKAERQMLLALATHPQDTNTTFTVGGEVSRFQRKTVPGKPVAAGGPPMMGAAGAPPPPPGVTGVPVRLGPVVRIARGNVVTEIPVGGK